MTTNSNDSMTDTTSRLDALFSILYKCINRSKDRLQKPNELSESLLYISIVLAVVVPILCFALFVYPTMMSYATNKTQIVSIPLLKQQLSQVKEAYQSSYIALQELETNTSSVAQHNTDHMQYNPIDLHRLAHNHQLAIVATDTLNGHAIPDQFAEHFTATQFSWHLKGSFSNYLTFKKALMEKYPLIHIAREHLTLNEGLQLDIMVDLNIYQYKAVVS